MCVVRVVQLLCIFVEKMKMDIYCMLQQDGDGKESV